MSPTVNDNQKINCTSNLSTRSVQLSWLFIMYLNRCQLKGYEGQQILSEHFLWTKNFVIDQWNVWVEIWLKNPLYKKLRHSVYENIRQTVVLKLQAKSKEAFFFSIQDPTISYLYDEPCHTSRFFLPPNWNLR